MAHVTEVTPLTGPRHSRDLLQRIGVGVVTGALAVSGLSLPALAETAAQPQATSSTASQAQQPQPPSGGGSPEGKPGEPPSGGRGAGGGADTMTFDYQGSYAGTVTADGSSTSSDGDSVSATDADQNALLAQNGGTLDVTASTVSKSGDDANGDNCNFYGLNSIGLAVGENSRINVSDTSLAATSEGSNGLFATDSGTVFANNDTISTTAGNSRGLDATYGGTIVANKMEITTQGDHSAALATDRGGGSVSVTNSSLETHGSGSPLLYSTGDIEVSDVTGTASGSQIAGMEGLNTILINGSSLASTNEGTTGSDPVANGVIIYQSTSGDAESTTGEAATFQAVDSTLKSGISSGSMFYLTNTTANVLLQNTTLDFDSSAANLLEAEGNDANNWGTAGSNGATVNFCGRSETMSGNVVADTISTANVYLLDGTTWTGAASIDQNANGSTSEAPISVSVDGSSTWVVTADSTISNLNVADGGRVVDGEGKTVTIVADGQTVVQGDSGVTVTVTGSYSTTVDAPDAAQLATETIDRSDFDAQYGTSTAFSLGNASSAAASTEEAGSSGTAGDQDEPQSLLDKLAEFFRGLFGF